MHLKEYLYIDQKRLNSYIEQIHPDSKIEKVPEWKVDIGLTGPKISASQKAQFRTLTQDEKIELLLKHLKKNNQVSHNIKFDKLCSFDKDKMKLITIPFVIMKICATKAVIPADKHHDTSCNKVIWFFSNYEDDVTGPGSYSKLYAVYLLEDYFSDDSTVNHPALSAYSGLVGMILNCYDDFQKTEVRHNNEINILKNGIKDTVMDKYAHEHPLTLIKKKRKGSSLLLT